MGCFGEDAPPQLNYGSEITGALNAQINLAPQLYSAEAQYQPLYNALNQEGMEDNLLGTPATSRQVTETYQQPMWTNKVTGAVTYSQPAVPGLWTQSSKKVTGPQTVTDPARPGYLSLYENNIAPAMNRVQSAQRTSDINDVMTLGPQAMAAMRAADPQSAGMLDTLNASAQQQLSRNGQMDPFMARALGQNVRTAQAARGVGYGQNDADAEAYYNAATMEQRRQQAQNFAGGVIGQNRQFYGDPFMQILGRAQSPANAQGWQQAQGMGQGGPRLFNPDDATASAMAMQNNNMRAQFAGPSVMSTIGQGAQIAGSVSQGLGLMGMCWVAREVYGVNDAKWKKFRGWLMREAPAKLRNLYRAHGEALAEWLREHPAMKPKIREWMDEQLAVSTN